MTNSKIYKNRKKQLAKFLLIVFGMLCTGTNLSARIIIEGNIDPTLGFDSISITYARNVIEESFMSSRGLIKNAKVTDGKYKFEIEDSSHTIYVKFNLPKLKPKEMGKEYLILRSQPFLIRENSHNQVNIGPMSIVFRGQEKQLLKCQMDLYHLEGKLSSEIIALSKESNLRLASTGDKSIADYLEKYQNLHNSAQDEAIAMLKKDYKTLDPSLSGQVLHDFIGGIRSDEINKIAFKVDRGRSEIRNDFLDFYLKNYRGALDSAMLANYEGESHSYAKYLAHKTTIDLFMTLWQVNKDLSPNLPLILDLVAKRFKGDLYDQVAFTTFLFRSITQYVDNETFSTLISNIKTEEYRNYIEKMRKSKSTRSMAYQFKLQSDEGKLLTNIDFKGKVVMLDFWFTGCAGCASLHKVMKPVKEHFKNNDNMVFASICVDDDENMWKNSVKEGKYTDEQDVKLWVGPAGSRHPMVQNYGISTYPTLIIIDGNDQVVAVNPPTPFNLQDKNALINMLEELLQK